jgi:cell division protein FtsI (penicillin-binding protein 3)
MRRVGNGAWIPVDIENLVEPQNGEDIITTLDINLQDLTESALQKELIHDSADHGCAVVMETKTGYIKAIANVGRFAGNYDEVYNYAVGESTEPGSTFKLASFLVGLEDGKIDLDQLVNCGNGEVNYHGAIVKDSHRGTGTITARQVFEKSSNVGTSKLIVAGYSDDPQRYIDGLYKLCINKPLHLQIGGEGNPYIKNTSDKFWSALSLPFMSFGYEVALTPMQLLTLYNAVANNGKMVRPLFVREIRKNGQIVQSFPPEVIKASITSPETLLKVKSLLEGVVDHGTAAGIKNPVYKIAGKTGTAQLAQNNKGYNKGTKAVKYKGSFIGYFPAENPQYTIIVVINNPTKGKYYGGAIAAPVFKEIADRIYANLQNVKNPPPRDTTQIPIPFVHAGSRKDIEEVYSYLKIPVKQMNNTVAWAMPAMDSLSVKLYPAPIYSGTMPNVTGMGIKDAVFLLEQLGLKVIVNGKGTVIRQSIEPGRNYRKGSNVVIDLSIQQEQKRLG